MSEQAEDILRTHLRGLADAAPDLTPPLPSILRGGKRRRRRRATGVGAAVLCLLAATATVVSLAHVHGHQQSFLAAAPTQPSTVAPAPTAPSGTDLGAASAILGTDGEWSVSTRRSDTNPDLICQDLVRAGVVQSTKTGAKPLVVPACATTDPGYASYHHAYLDAPTDPTSQATVEFGRAPLGTVAVRLTQTDGTVVQARLATVYGVVVWAAQVASESVAAVAASSEGETTDLKASAMAPCLPYTDAKPEIPVASPCPRLTADPDVVQNGVTPASVTVEAQVAHLLPDGWKLKPSGGANADGTAFERVTGTLGDSGLNVLLQQQEKPTAPSAFPSYLSVTTDKATGVVEATSQQNGLSQVIVQEPAGLFVNVTYTVYSGEPSLTFAEVKAIAEKLARS